MINKITTPVDGIYWLKSFDTTYLKTSNKKFIDSTLNFKDNKPLQVNDFSRATFISQRP